MAQRGGDDPLGLAHLALLVDAPAPRTLLFVHPASCFPPSRSLVLRLLTTDTAARHTETCRC